MLASYEHANWLVYLLTVVLLLPLWYWIRRAAATDKPQLYVRKIAGISAIDETIGQAVESGRPTVFTTGLTSINPVLYACLGIVHYVAKKIARYKSRLIVPQYNPEVLAIAEDTVRSAYSDAGRSENFNPDNLPYLSDDQFAYAAGYIGLVQRENVGGAFLFGQFAAESLILAEAGQQIGAKQVGASISPEQVAFFIVACDYTLIGEELFAASAYLTDDPIQVGSLYAQDTAKVVVVVIIIAGILVATASTWQTLLQ